MTSSTLGWLLPLTLLAATGCRSTQSAPSVEPVALAAGRAPVLAQGKAAEPSSVGIDPGHVGAGTPLTPAPGHALAAFAEGCFWGSENTFRKVPGVVATAVGYAGGHTPMPTYEKVCTHTTGHAETVLVEFDPTRVSYEALLGVFFGSHDPTTLNRQGPDEGDQYRSEIFTFSDDQAKAARAAMAEAQKHTSRPIVTKIEPVPAFYKAEDYHQQYDEKTGSAACPIGHAPSNEL